MTKRDLTILVPRNDKIFERTPLLFSLGRGALVDSRNISERFVDVDRSDLGNLRVIYARESVNISSVYICYIMVSYFGYRVDKAWLIHESTDQGIIIN